MKEDNRVFNGELGGETELKKLRVIKCMFSGKRVEVRKGGMSDKGLEWFGD